MNAKRDKRTNRTLPPSRRMRLLTAVLALALAFSLAGCGGGAKDTAAQEVAVESFHAMPTAAQAKADSVNSAEGAARDEAGEMGETEDGAGIDAQATDLGATNSQPNIKMIWRAYLDIETKEFDALLGQLNEAIAQVGGFVENSTVTGRSDSPDYQPKYASITARIPTPQLDGFLGTVGELGNVTRTEKSGENITLQYADTEARKNALQVEYDRLLELLASAKDVETVVVLEARLSEVRFQLEEYSASLRGYDNLVEYSTVTMNIEEVRKITETDTSTIGQRIKAGLGDTLFDLKTFGENLLVFLVVKLPVFALLALLAAVVVLAVRFVKKHRKPRKLTPPGTGGTAPSYGEQLAVPTKPSQTQEPSAKDEP